MKTIVPIVVLAAVIDVFESLSQFAQILIAAAALIAALGVLWRKLLRPVIRAAHAIIDLVALARTIERRVRRLEQKLKTVDRLIEVLRDEGREDVLKLLRGAAQGGRRRDDDVQ